MKLTVLSKQPFASGLVLKAEGITLDQGTPIDLGTYIKNQGSNYAEKMGMFSDLSPADYTFFSIELELSEGQMGILEVLVEDLYGSLKKVEELDYIYEVNFLTGETTRTPTNRTYLPKDNWKPVIFELEVSKVEVKNHLFRQATLSVNVTRLIPIHQKPSKLPSAFQYVIPEGQEDYSWI